MNVCRLQRATAMGVGVMLLLTPLVGVNTMIGEAGLAAPWWTPVSVGLLVAAGLGLILVASGQYDRCLQSVAVFAALTQLAAVLLWILARTGVRAAPDSINPIWATVSSMLVAVALVTAFNYRVAAAYVALVLSALTVAYSLAHDGTWLLPVEVMRTVVSGALIGVFLAVIRAAMIVARRVDDERSRALANAAATAARNARAEERRRFDAVVRDEVITALRTVRPGRPEQVQRDQAHSALAVLERGCGQRPSVLPPDLARRRLRQSVIDHGDHIAVVLDVDPEALAYPARAIDAVVDATGEAVANSLRHAGPGASVAVVGQLAADVIRVRIVDDGDGFNPDRVPGDRLGIEVGIRRRMHDLAGGAADIESSRGSGTMVSLEWRRR